MSFAPRNAIEVKIYILNVESRLAEKGTQMKKKGGGRRNIVQ